MKFTPLVDPIQLVNQYNLICIYGKNENLAYSIFNEFSGSVLDIKDFDNINLLQQSLIPESNLKFKITAKDMKKFLQNSISRWNRKCIVLLEKDPLIKEFNEIIAEISCDSVNMKKFIEFHSKRLDYSFGNTDDLFWVKDLHDLHFAYKIKQLAPENLSNIAVHEINQMNLIKKNDSESLKKFWQLMENPWSWIRYLQYFYNYQNKSNIVAMLKHLELWCYRNVPNDEVFIWLIRSILMKNDIID